MYRGLFGNTLQECYLIQGNSSALPGYIVLGCCLNSERSTETNHTCPPSLLSIPDVWDFYSCLVKIIS